MSEPLKLTDPDCARPWPRTRSTCSGSNLLPRPAGCGGRLAGQARGYRSSFYCHTLDSRNLAGVGRARGLSQVFGVGGVARESAVTWSRCAGRSLCYAFGCWEVLEQTRPRPIDVIVGRSAGLGSAPVRAGLLAGRPVVNSRLLLPRPQPRPGRGGRAGYPGSLLSLAAGDGRDRPPRSGKTVAGLDSHRLAARPVSGRVSRRVSWSCTTASTPGASPLNVAASRPAQAIGGRAIPRRTRVVTFVARSLDRLRGFDRFLKLANALLRARADVVVVVVGDPNVRRALDVDFHSRDYRGSLMADRPSARPDRLWFLGTSPPRWWPKSWLAATCTSAPSRPYPVSRSLLEAMAAGVSSLASRRRSASAR